MDDSCRRSIAQHRSLVVQAATSAAAIRAVLAIVERLNESKLATIDRRHFSLLQPEHVEALVLLPE